jgi:hypothetical protein
MSYAYPKQVDWNLKPEWAKEIAYNNILDYPSLYWISDTHYCEFISAEGKPDRHVYAYSNHSNSYYFKTGFTKFSKKDDENFKADKKPKYSPYHRLMQSQYDPIYDADGKFLGLMVDAYDVFEAFDPQDRTEPETHALKKLLIPGKRGAKEIIQDIKEAIWSLNLSLVKRVHREAKNKYLNK